ncbi:MAG: 2'-5' RNA ligase family protein [Patescibacteria group bacterium]|jgi:2'-5' RNA ligase
MEYYVGVPLPQPLDYYIHVVRRTWGCRNKSDPHLTLMVPRSLLPNRTERELTTALAGIAAQPLVFEVSINGFGVFEEIGNLHLVVDRSDQLVACCKAIDHAVEGILAPSASKYAHIPSPHITVLDRLPQKDLALALAQLGPYKFGPTHLQCSTLHLFKDGNSTIGWQIAQTIRLS